MYSRQFRITGYADEFTKKAFTESRQEKTFLIIKPEVYTQMGKIISVIEQNSFRISRMKMVKLEPEEVLHLFEERKGDPFIQDTV